MSLITKPEAAIDYTKPNYPKNCWWVAARQEEVGREPLGRWMLDRPVVLYRTENGEAVALENRCMHRWAPISTGFLEGDSIVCGYHGATFGPDGRCQRYPTQAKVPSHARVQSYPVLERAPFIWIWMGDPEAMADAPEPVAYDWVGDTSWLVAQGYMEFSANYFLLHENVLDLTHFNFLHRNSFGITDQPVPKYEADGDTVVFRLEQEDFQIMTIHSDLATLKAPLRRKFLNRFVTPALHEANVWITEAPGGGNHSGFQTKIVHCVTPLSPGRTHYWWLLAQDFGNVPGAAEGLQKGIEMAAAEDKMMLEAVQEMMTRDERGLDSTELSFNGDGGGILARRALQRLLDREANTSA